MTANSKQAGEVLLQNEVLTDRIASACLLWEVDFLGNRAANVYQS
jgi:hypothetical protein